MGRYDAWNGIKLAGKIIYAGGVVFLWVVQLVSVRLVVYAHILSTLIGVVLVVLLLWRGRIGTPRIDVSLLGRMLWYGGRNFLTSLTGQANARLDQALISAFLSPSQLGLYRIAVSASQSIRLVSSGFRGIIISKVSQAEDPETGEHQILESLRASGVALVLSAVLLLGALPFLVPFMYGNEYEGAILAAQILLIAAVIFGLKQTLINGIRGQGRPEVGFYAELAGTVVTGIGLYILLRMIGIEGAAVTSLLAYGVSFGVAYFLFWRQRKKGAQSR
jgi:O-antigen/teichoic acid export membrane protein